MPYLHGKREELLALRNLGTILSDSVVPIIKPVTLGGPAVGSLGRIAQQNRFALVLNSDRGPHRQPPSYADTLRVFGYPAIAPYSSHILPAFELRSDSSLQDFEAFSRQFEDRQCVVIHKRHSFSADQLRKAGHFTVDPVNVYVEPGVSAAAFSPLPSRAKIIIRDGFAACGRNADYPERSAFDDLAFQYSARDFDGFGDFSMIGDTYSWSGGPAGAVALHLTESDGRGLFMNHFVSTSVGMDVRTMYFEAVAALCAFVGRPPRAGMDTEGVRQYLQSSQTRHFPNLGPAKRWSTMHHIETIQSILAQRGATPRF